jgi:hypothetical protein
MLFSSSSKRPFFFALSNKINVLSFTLHLSFPYTDRQYQNLKILTHGHITPIRSFSLNTENTNISLHSDLTQYLLAKSNSYLSLPLHLISALMYRVCTRSGCLIVLNRSYREI